MRGTVLGFADEKGVIVTEDDRRFGFTRANWRDEQQPLRGAVVDFVERDGGADEIYLALGAKPPRPSPVPAGAPGAGFGQGDGMRVFMDKLKAFPQLAVAAFVLLVFIFITYATVPTDLRSIDRENRELREYPTLLGLNGTLSTYREEIRDRQDEMERGLEQLRSVPAGPADEFRTKALRTAERVGGAVNWLSWVVTFAMIFWLVPLAAIGVIALYLLGKRTFALISSIVLAVLCVLSGVYIWVLESAVGNVASAALTGSGDDRLRDMRRGVDRAFELGIGGWLLLLCGIGLIVLLVLGLRKGAPPPAAV
ncbi:MAG TPA: hypothetical protein VGO55_11460 [Allosphingosinicella sp.]|jgi:hypothetical protein|nr:hypothetical protein [Allosphingosinicella sp.]